MENVSPSILFPLSLYPKCGHFQCDSVHRIYYNGFWYGPIFLLNIYLENGELG